ncbi:MAG: TRAP transporter substrate-binding protein DctP [Ectothiorhodospiraceae bacterium]|nr:TRAP transporter substrate-binding protein DctP [Ectothiorhodospiraceae bacterium]
MNKGPIKAACGAVLAASMLAASGAALAESFHFRVTSALPPTHGLWVGFYKPWMEQVEAESDGRITFTAFVSGELVRAANEPDALEQGTVHIAAPLLPSYDPSSFPMSEVAMLPLAKSSPHIGSRAWKALIESDVELQDGKTFAELEYGRHGLKGLPATISDEFSISTTGQRFESISDLEGVTIRTPTRIHEIYARKAGFNSITMPVFDLFDAMSRGAVDGSLLFISDWTGYGFEQLFEYTVTDLSLGHFSSLMGMTQAQWDAIPEDLQQIMLDAIDDNIDKGADVWAERRVSTIEESKAQGGEFISVHDLNPEVAERLQSAMEETWFEYIRILEEQGAPGTELARLWRDIVIEHGGDVPEAIHDL